MNLLQLCDPEAAAVPAEATVADAIHKMLDYHVGAVGVVDQRRPGGRHFHRARRPSEILPDRSRSRVHSGTRTDDHSGRDGDPANRSGRGHGHHGRTPFPPSARGRQRTANCSGCFPSATCWSGASTALRRNWTRWSNTSATTAPAANPRVGESVAPAVLPACREGVSPSQSDLPRMPDHSAASKTIAVTRIATGFLFLLFGEYKVAGPAFAHGDFQKYLDGFIQDRSRLLLPSGAGTRRRPARRLLRILRRGPRTLDRRLAHPRHLRAPYVCSSAHSSC